MTWNVTVGVHAAHVAAAFCRAPSAMTAIRVDLAAVRTPREVPIAMESGVVSTTSPVNASRPNDRVEDRPTRFNHSARSVLDELTFFS
jgi:hypothetical protein